jgi:protein-disulfide isomerase
MRPRGAEYNAQQGDFMKYAQLIIGLLAGTALGGAVVASTGAPVGSAMGTTLSKADVQAIVRETISSEPKLILESVQKYQDTLRNEQDANASAALKDKAVRDEVFNYPDAAFIGPKDATKIVVEFFDYDCPACKMMFKGIDQLVHTDKNVKVIFREYPIFGPVSDNNAKIGIAVSRLYPAQYFVFHEKMMSGQGHDGSEKKTMGILKDLGFDVEKVKAEAAKPDVQATLDATRKTGDKLHIQGTPTLVIGDEIVPHALGYDELKAKVDAEK